NRAWAINSGRRQVRISGRNQIGNIGGKLANKNIRSMVAIVRHETALERLKSDRAAISAHFRNGRRSDRRADPVGVSIDQRGDAGLDVPQIQMIIPSKGVGHQPGGAAEERDKPSSGIDRRPIARGIGGDMASEIAADKSGRPRLAVPKINASGSTGYVVGICYKSNEASVRRHFQRVYVFV